MNVTEAERTELAHDVIKILDAPRDNRLEEVISMRYAIVIEHAGANYSAYAPDLPGCVATGESLANVAEKMREAVEFHLGELREDGIAVPAPASRVEYIDVTA